MGREAIGELPQVEMRDAARTGVEGEGATRLGLRPCGDDCCRSLGDFRAGSGGSVVAVVPAADERRTGQSGGADADPTQRGPAADACCVQ